MGMCRGHGEEELLITGVEDDAEEKVKFKKKTQSAHHAYLVLKNVTRNHALFLLTVFL